LLRVRTARQSSKISSLNRLWSFAPLASSEMAKANTRKFDSPSDPAHRRQIVLNTWVTLFLLWGGGHVVAVGGGLRLWTKVCSSRRGSHGRPQPLNCARFSGFRASGRTRVSFTSVRVRLAALLRFRVRRCLLFSVSFPSVPCRHPAPAVQARELVSWRRCFHRQVKTDVRRTRLGGARKRHPGHVVVGGQIVSEPPLGLVWLQGTAKLYSVHVLLLFCSTSGRECCNALQWKLVDCSGW
jgi:hypothetical protein